MCIYIYIWVFPFNGETKIKNKCILKIGNPVIPWGPTFPRQMSQSVFPLICLSRNSILTYLLHQFCYLIWCSIPATPPRHPEFNNWDIHISILEYVLCTEFFNHMFGKVRPKWKYPRHMSQESRDCMSGLIFACPCGEISIHFWKHPYVTDI